MKLSQWAKQQGLCYRTAWNMYHAGKLGVPAKQLATGTIIVDVSSVAGQSVNPVKAIVYTRVSSHDQKKDLPAQVDRCISFLKKKKLPASDVVMEVGSGLNSKRKKLLALLADPDITHLVVDHRDRLMRFGSEMVEASLKARGVELLIVEDHELEDDLVEDMVSILTSFCARLYGKRSAKHRAERMLAAGAEPATKKE